MKDRRKDPKYLKRYQERGNALTRAHLIYRAALRVLVGTEEFENIDSRQTDDCITLCQAAKDWLEGTWLE